MWHAHCIDISIQAANEGQRPLMSFFTRDLPVTRAEMRAWRYSVSSEIRFLSPQWRVPVEE